MCVGIFKIHTHQVICPKKQDWRKEIKMSATAISEQRDHRKYPPVLKSSATLSEEDEVPHPPARNTLTETGGGDVLALPGLASLHPHPLPPLHPHAPWGPSEALLQLMLFQVCSLLLPQAAGLLSSRGLTLHTPCASSHCTHLSEISTGSGLASLTPSPILQLPS